MLKSDRSERTYDRTLTDSLSKLKLLGFKEFRMDLPDYPSPTGFLMKGKDDFKVVPDIVADYGGRRSFIEISKKTDNPTQLVSKWKLLSKMAGLKNAFFGIITPKGTIKYTQELIDRYQIEAKLIRI